MELMTMVEGRRKWLFAFQRAGELGCHGRHRGEGDSLFPRAGGGLQREGQRATLAAAESVKARSW